ncbi:glycosyltransferase [Flavobacterium sp. GP15]|uniref:glycosyltransferase n=1 Tax=Flavobacterium sp. GP15 TaxID=2758567 RepID=UPI00165DD08A|nr:glycosyltransferase [Flavobacterium sp. GP15]
MILIDAVFVNNGGGKVLLDYLIESLEQTEIKVFYLLDNRIINKHPLVKEKNQILFIKANLIARHQFYRSHRETFSKILCFGNLPPSMRLSAEVFTYFHQPLFINIPMEVSWMNKFKIKSKMFILNKFKNNTNKWLVQSNNVKIGLCNKYKLKEKSIILMPFYPPMPRTNDVIRKKNKFVYISNLAIHKNHQRLIKAFCCFYDRFKLGELGLTICESATLEINALNSLQKKGYPITNYGFIKREKLADIFASSEYLIFPSLAESFGLGIVEAIESGCKIIGADLAYTYEICQPSLTFDPMSINDLEYAFIRASTENLPPTIKIINNKIKNLVKLLD